MAKKKTAPKFADKSQQAGLLVRECPQCHKFHHPRVAKCPNCEHEYPPVKRAAKKVVKKKPDSTPGAPSTAAAKADGRLQAGIELLVACRGDLAEARSLLKTIEQIRKL